MESWTEVARIRAAYREYAMRHFAQSKWSRSNPGNQAILHERDSQLRDRLERAGFFPLSRWRMLDLGCGTGEQIGTFLDWGAKPENLCGIDLIPDRIRLAQRQFPQVTLQVANAESLPYGDGTFHLIGAFTVFSSILDPRMAINISHEINRVLTPGGVIVWYDFRTDNPFNKHVQGMSRNQVQRLFPDFRLSLQSISLFPPLARRLASLTGRLYGPLSSVPFLRTHLLGLLTKPGGPITC
jgi:SAM-dependent methyltransferase